MINNSFSILDLRIPPANRLEKLKGKREEQFSIRINRQWRTIMAKLKNIHPGEILKEEFLIPMGITAYRLSKSLGIPQTRTSQIINGKRGISVDTALRLAKYFGNSVEFWLGIQNDYEIEEQKMKIKDVLEQIESVNDYRIEHPA